jgi:hypothetical protein
MVVILRVECEPITQLMVEDLKEQELLGVKTRLRGELLTILQTSRIEYGSSKGNKEFITPTKYAGVTGYLGRNRRGPTPRCVPIPAYAPFEPARSRSGGQWGQWSSLFFLDSLLEVPNAQHRSRSMSINVTLLSTIDNYIMRPYKMPNIFGKLFAMYVLHSNCPFVYDT